MARRTSGERTLKRKGQKDLTLRLSFEALDAIEGHFDQPIYDVLDKRLAGRPRLGDLVVIFRHLLGDQVSDGPAGLDEAQVIFMADGAAASDLVGDVLKATLDPEGKQSGTKGGTPTNPPKGKNKVQAA